MQALLVLGTLIAFGAFWAIGKGYKAGESPFDRLPPGVSGKPSQTRVETVADGTAYRVSDWAPSLDGRSFHVAEVNGNRLGWVSFWLEPTGKRTLYMALAEAGDLNDLRKDWAV